MLQQWRFPHIRNLVARASAWTKRFARAEQGATAIIFGLACITILLAGGVGLDLARAMVLKSRMAEALDAAGLAVGTSSGLTQAQMTTLAQQYFNANYPTSALGTPGSVSVTVGGNNGSTISLSVTGTVPTTLMQLANINTLGVTVTNEITKSLTKLWVALVFDNTGSMTQTDSTGLSKISALKTAAGQLLTILQNAASNPGDVMVSLIPFSKDVNLGTSNVNANWIDWTDWESSPANGTVSTSVGPASNCPYSTGSNGYRCQSTPTNGSSNASTIPSSGSYAGYICPSVDDGSKNTGRMGRYYNGCYNSVGTTSTNSNTTTTNTTLCSNKTTCTTAKYCTGYPTTNTTTSGNTTTVTTTTCACPSSGGGGKQTCTATATAVATTTTVGAPYTHTWLVNNHSTWGGCVMDRTQNYDVATTTPSGTSTDFPAENAQSCVPSVMLGTLTDDWTGLNTAVSAMTAGGSTNQPIGLAWGWQSFTSGNPLNAGTLPANTTEVIILVSDGLNTQDRWYGDGSNDSTSVDSRESSVCTSAKNAGIVIYTVFVDLNGTQGNSAPLQSCATDNAHYFDLTTSGEIITTLNQIGQTLANLHVAE